MRTRQRRKKPAGGQRPVGPRDRRAEHEAGALALEVGAEAPDQQHERQADEAHDDDRGADGDAQPRGEDRQPQRAEGQAGAQVDEVGPELLRKGASCHGAAKLGDGRPLSHRGGR
jgi:hypothetical protein